MTAGSTPATPEATTRASGSAPSRSAPASDASTRQAAPSLRVEALPAVTVPPFRKAGRSRARALERGVGSRPLVGFDQHRVAAVGLGRDDRHQLLGEASGGGGVDGALVAAKRELVLSIASDRIALGDVLGRLAHRLGRVALGHRGVDQPPPERRVVHRLRASRQARLGLGHHPRRAAHRLRAAGQVELTLAEAKRPGGAVDCLEPRGAEPVHGHARDLDRKACEQRRHPRDVAVVLAGLVGGAPVDVGDALGVEPGALERGADRVGGEIVGANSRERAAVAAHRRADGVENQRLAHRPRSCHHPADVAATRGSDARPAMRCRGTG